MCPIISSIYLSLSSPPRLSIFLPTKKTHPLEEYYKQDIFAITVAAKDTAVPVLTDMRRITIYNAASIESQTYNNTLVSTRTVLDDLVYTLSQESHSMKIRQQDPETKLWSLCEIRSFLSNGGARSSIWILWSEIDVSYEAPTT